MDIFYSEFDKATRDSGALGEPAMTYATKALEVTRHVMRGQGVDIIDQERMARCVFSVAMHAHKSNKAPSVQYTMREVMYGTEIFPDGRDVYDYVNMRNVSSPYVVTDNNFYAFDEILRRMDGVVLAFKKENIVGKDITD